MNRRLIYMPLLFALLIVGGMYIGLIMGGTGRQYILNIPATGNYSNKIDKILHYVEQEYVDTVNKEQIVDDAIAALLRQLDPHSAYIPASELKAMNEPLEGNFEGIGIEFNIIDDTIRVVSPIAGGPSEAVGIMAGDKIIAIEGKNVAGVKVKNQYVLDNLRGAGGTKVKVSIARAHSSGLLDFTITRGKIPIYSVDASYMLAPATGYIKVSRFAAQTYREFMDAAGKLKNKGMTRLVLDLRGNPGGYLDAAVNMADEFLPDGKMIVYTQGKAQPKRVHNASSKGSCENIPLVILIDEGSASASEILAGAVQDNDRGTIIGRRSFGKGLVQEQREFDDGSAIRLTISRYYTPTGRSIQKPYKKGYSEEYYLEELDRLENGELQHADSIKKIDSLKYITPAGKVVYGGGGIMPDIFVPVDTTYYSHYLNELVYKGLLNQFAFSFCDRKRNDLKREYKTEDDFINSFIVDPGLLEELYVFAEKNSVMRNEAGMKRSKDFISNQLKAIIARHIWGNEAFYKTLNVSDRMIQESLKAVK